MDFRERDLDDSSDEELNRSLVSPESEDEPVPRSPSVNSQLDSYFKGISNLDELLLINTPPNEDKKRLLRSKPPSLQRVQELRSEKVDSPPRKPSPASRKLEYGPRIFTSFPSPEDPNTFLPIIPDVEVEADDESSPGPSTRRSVNPFFLLSVADREKTPSSSSTPQASPAVDLYASQILSSVLPQSTTRPKNVVSAVKRSLESSPSTSGEALKDGKRQRKLPEGGAAPVAQRRLSYEAKGSEPQVRRAVKRSYSHGNEKPEIEEKQPRKDE